MEQTRRDMVIELLCAGHRPAAIIKLLMYPRRTVYDSTKKWEESGMSKRKEHKPTKGNNLLMSLKTKCTGHLRFFSDAKVFTVDRSSNRRNDRWICRDPIDVSMVFRTENPASIMVLGVICSNGAVMPPHFFGPKEKVNMEVYLNVVVPWMDFQDSAPAHKAKLVQSWLKKNVPNFWDFNTWPPNSPDLNPCDYYLKGKLEREVSATHHSNVASLKASIKSEMNKLDPAEVSTALYCLFFYGFQLFVTIRGPLLQRR
ncbi:Transposable element tcb2 transposase [Caligus rogercresseyi]|uniref:Transposable element tcb2 transposase n=1 Tax=Caligus rogercresseyi TaxID=217165 RepID=A0A7T8HM85_CALRO|nr:Transposable element tcb2 transposase [Caligus rogercresseyi]